MLYEEGRAKSPAVRDDFLKKIDAAGEMDKPKYNIARRSVASYVNPARFEEQALQNILDGLEQ